MPATRTQPESRIRNAVRLTLQRGGWFVFPVVQGPLSYRGIADLLAVRGGVAVAVECKTATGRLSDAQEAFRRDWQAAGCEFVVARSSADVAHLVDCLPLATWGTIDGHPRGQTFTVREADYPDACARLADEASQR